MLAPLRRSDPEVDQHHGLPVPVADRLQDAQGALVERPCRRLVARVAEDRGEVDARLGDGQVVAGFLRQRQSLAQTLFGAEVVAVSGVLYRQQAQDLADGSRTTTLPRVPKRLQVELLGGREVAVEVLNDEP